MEKFCTESDNLIYNRFDMQGKSSVEKYQCYGKNISARGV